MAFGTLLMRCQSDALCRINALEHLRELNSAPSVGMHDVPRECLLEHLGFGKESDTQDKLDERLARKSPSLLDEPTKSSRRLLRTHALRV